MFSATFLLLFIHWWLYSKTTSELCTNSSKAIITNGSENITALRGLFPAVTIVAIDEKASLAGALETILNTQTFDFSTSNVVKEWSQSHDMSNVIEDTTQYKTISDALIAINQNRLAILITANKCTEKLVRNLEDNFLYYALYAHVFCVNYADLTAIDTMIFTMLEMNVRSAVLMSTREYIEMFFQKLSVEYLPRIRWFIPDFNAADETTDCIHVVETTKGYTTEQIIRFLNKNFTCNSSNIRATYTEEVKTNANKIDNLFTCGKNRTILKVVTKVDPPFVTEVPQLLDSYAFPPCGSTRSCLIPVVTTSTGEVTWRRSCCSGLSVEIFELLATDLQFEYELYAVEDGQYGGWVNNSWTGIVGDVWKGKAQVGIQGLTATVARSLFVDFTQSYIESSIGIVQPKKATDLPIINWKFQEFLQFDIIVALFVTLLATCIATFFHENAIRLITKTQRYFPSRDCLAYVAGLMFQRDLLGKTPYKWSSRIIAIAYATAMTVVMTTYTANLTANNIMYTQNNSFEGLKDSKILEPTVEFKFGAQLSTNTELYFKDSEQLKFRNVYAFLQKYLQPSDFIGMRKVKNGELQAYLGDYVYLKYILAKAEFCSYLTLYNEKSYEMELSFVVAKGSPWNYRLSKSILKHRESGEIDELIAKWFYLPACLAQDNKAYRLSWRYIGGMMVVSGGAVCVCIFILLLENAWTKIKVTRSEKLKKEKSFEDIPKRNRGYTTDTIVSS